jgi:Uri superfamily endonuclease
MDRVKKYIADTQEEKRHVAYVHCHAVSDVVYVFLYPTEGM